MVERSGVGAKQRLNDTEDQKRERIKKLSEAVKTIFECIGEDPNREGLLRTPERYAKALMFFSKGYEESLEGACQSMWLFVKSSCIISY